MNIQNWDRASIVPSQGLKTIDGGKLKGKTQISPQWRVKKMTEIYGMCGIGWKWQTVEKETQENPHSKEIMCFVTVHLFVKDGETWSEPIEGNGSSMTIQSNRNGKVSNDDGWKMATTDALGTAMKFLGIASSIYEGNWDGSKYKNLEAIAPVQVAQTPKVQPKDLPLYITEKAVQYIYHFRSYFWV